MNNVPGARALVGVDLDDVEDAILGEPEVEDCAVMARESEGRGLEFHAYLILSGPLDLDALQSRLRSRLPALAEPVVLQPVRALPLNAEGAIDGEALRLLPVIEPSLLERCQRQARALDGVDEVAVVVREATPAPAPMHLADVLPGWKPRRGATPVRTGAPANAERQEASAAGPPAVSHGPALLPEPGAPETLVGALGRAASAATQREVRCLRGDGGESRWTYRELLDDARRIAAGLRLRGARKGDTAIFQLDRNEDFIPCLWGCILAGVVPVPLAASLSYDVETSSVRKLLGAIAMFERPLILTAAHLAPSLRARVEARGAAGIRVETIEALRAHAPEEPDAAIDSQDTALFMLTSGSTGAPKAVVLTHQNLVALSRGATLANGYATDDVMLNWMPLDHVAGLIYFHLLSTHVGCSQVHAPTDVIYREPLRWLEWIERFRVTRTFAPNFAFGLVNDREAELARRRFDLSSVRWVANGAEPIVARTARRFLRLLAPHGLAPTAMQPAWGMSETSSGVTCSDRFTLDTTSDDDSFVEVGAPIPGFSMRIVDGRDEVVPEGVEGRLQVKGASVMSGYFGDPEANRRSFTADGWFQTGDLGRLSGGRLTITGREKDVIIINSVNYYSHEIESAVEESQLVEPSFTAACAVRDGASETDLLAIFFHQAEGVEISAELLQAIRTQVMKRVGVTPDFLIPTGRSEIPKTEIGKIQRAELVRRFASGQFDAILKQVDRIEGNANTLPDWFFRPVWCRREIPPRRAAAPLGRALVVLDSHGLGEALAAELGQDAIMVEPGTEFARLGGARYRLRLADASHHRRLAEEVAADGARVDRLIHLGGYGPAQERACSVQALSGALEEGLLGVTFLAHAFRGDGEAPVRMVLGASHAQAAREGEPVLGERAAAAGLVRTLAAELPGLGVRHVDLPFGDHAQNAARLARELGASDPEPEVAYRDGERLVRRLEQARLDEEEKRPLPIKVGGLYLVTGGLGGLGLEVARMLVTRFGARLLLVGRTPLPPRSEWDRHLDGDDTTARAIVALRSLEELGGSVLHAAADVADPEQLERAIGRAEGRFDAELEGVFHLAGAYEARLLAEVDAEHLAAALRAKAIGSWVLARRMARVRGGLFVAFSSVNSFLGGLSAGAYAAANRFLESCMAQASMDGTIDARCVAWSMWDGVGMGRALAMKSLSQSRGFHAISVERGVLSLLAALHAPGAHLLVGLAADNPRIRRWTRGPVELASKCTAACTRLPEAARARLPASLTSHDRSGRPVTCEILALDVLPRGASGEVDRAQLLARLRGERRAEGDSPRSPAEEALAAIWKQVLGVQSIGVRDNFFEFGGHSLHAMRAVSLINAAFRASLTIRALFEHPTIEHLGELLAARAQGDPGAAAAMPTADTQSITFEVHPQARFERFPLTDLQLAYWLGRNDNLPLGGNGCHLYWEIESEGWDIDRLERALRALVARHDMLRAVFLPGGYQQVLERAPALSIERFDRSGADEAAAMSQLEEVRRRMSHARLPAERCPLLRVAVTQMPRRMRLHFSIDMLIADGESILALLQEWAELYHAAAEAAPPVAVTFRDYVLHGEKIEKTDAFRRSLAFWSERLRELPPAPKLPLARDPSTLRSPTFVRREVRLEPALWRALSQRARARGLTPSATLLGAYAEAIATGSDSPAFTLNLTVANRLPVHPQIQQVLVDFSSTLLTAVDGSREAPFAERAARIQERLLEGLEHRAVSGVRLVQKLATSGRAPWGMPVVFTSLLDHGRVGQQAGPQRALGRIVHGITQTPQVWIDCHVHEEDGALRTNWDAVEALFPEGLLDRMFAVFADRLRQLAEDEAAWTSVPTLPRSPLLHEGFVRQAQSAPERAALVAGDVRLTYGELHRRARGLAARLRDLGARPNELVAVVMDKGWEQIAAVLAIGLAGAAYLPIDASSPPARMAQLLEAGEARIALTQPHATARLQGAEGVEVLVVDEAATSVDAAGALPAAQSPEDLAYVIFTSGSTGVPKGVMIDHRGAWNTIEDINRRFEIGPGDRILGLSSLSFDLSVYDVFGTLAVGATLVLPDASSLPNPERLLALARRERVSVWNSVPSYMQLVMDFVDGRAGGPSLEELRVVLLSGDWIPVSLPDRIRAQAPRARVISLGGATEASIWSIAYEIERVDPSWRSIPYGKALANQKVVVLDEELAPQQVGVPGDLFIGGVGVALGYFRDRDKTEASFFVHPATGERLYRTGDRGALMPDGNIEFLGRVDRQVKVAGYRIDMGEVDAVASKHPGVSEVATVAYRDSSGNRRLAAFFVPHPRADVQPEDMRSFLKERLPAYMVPAQLEALPRLPLTSNGKLDRESLERRAEARGRAGAPPAAPPEPRSPPEEQRRADASGPDELLKNPKLRAAFVEQKMGLRADLAGRTRFALDGAEVEPWRTRAVQRRSHRRFLRGEPVGGDDLRHLLGCLRGYPHEGATKYLYPSAGSAYPLQTYLHARSGRIEGLPAGLYYYHPIEHALMLVAQGIELSREIHHPINQDLAEQAAFTIFLVANLGAIAPLYGAALGRDFALLEAGAVSQQLMLAAEECGLGLCPIGTLTFDAVRAALGLGEQHLLVHSLVGGRPALTVAQGVQSVHDARDAQTVAAMPVAARLEVEAQLTRIICDVLEREAVGVHDNLFDIGGNSFLILRIQRRILDELSRDCSLTDLFERPTIHQLAGRLCAGAPDAPPAPGPRPPEAVHAASSTPREGSRADLRRNIRASIDGRRQR